jgi:glutathione S-transferase
MAEFTFYTVAMSRGQIARWALHEAGADYEDVVFDWQSRPAGFNELNPMGKVPVLVHHRGDKNHVVTEAAAICHYLAETNPDVGLLPNDDEKAPYFRWLFFAAGPLEQAVIAAAMRWEVSEDRTAMAGFGTLERTLDAIDGWLSTNDYATGNRFTMADCYLGSQFIWGLRFGTIPERPSFKAYVERCTAREKCKEAVAVDQALIDAAGQSS